MNKENNKEYLIEALEDSYKVHFDNIYSSLSTIDYKLHKIKKDEELKELKKFIFKELDKIKDKINFIKS